MYMREIVNICGMFHCKIQVNKEHHKQEISFAWNRKVSLTEKKSNQLTHKYLIFKMFFSHLTNTIQLVPDIHSNTQVKSRKN